MKFFRQAGLLIVGMFFFSVSLSAQDQQMQNAQPDSITDQELQKFINTASSLQTIQEETQKEVEAVVEKEGMEFERFQEILMSKQNPQVAQDVEVTKEEEKKIENVQPKLIEINQKVQQEFVQAIQEEGLTPRRFQQIVQAVRTDPEVSQRFQKMAAETTDPDGS